MSLIGLVGAVHSCVWHYGKITPAIATWQSISSICMILHFAIQFFSVQFPCLDELCFTRLDPTFLSIFIAVFKALLRPRASFSTLSSHSEPLSPAQHPRLLFAAFGHSLVLIRHPGNRPCGLRAVSFHPLRHVLVWSC